MHNIGLFLHNIDGPVIFPSCVILLCMPSASFNQYYAEISRYMNKHEIIRQFCIMFSPILSLCVVK